MPFLRVKVFIFQGSTHQNGVGSLSELLELDKGDIRVAQYLTAMPPKEELEEKLRLAIQRAKIQLEQRKE